MPVDSIATVVTSWSRRYATMSCNPSVYAENSRITSASWSALTPTQTQCERDPMSIPAACALSTDNPSTRRSSASTCAADLACALARRRQYAIAICAALPTFADAAAAVRRLRIDYPPRAMIEGCEPDGSPARRAGEADRDQFFKREPRPDQQGRSRSAVTNDEAARLPGSYSPAGGLDASRNTSAEPSRCTRRALVRICLVPC